MLFSKLSTVEGWPFRRNRTRPFDQQQAEGIEEPVYIPEHFRVRDHADALAFMRANPFAILISSVDAGPFATHVPLLSARKGRRDSPRPRGQGQPALAISREASRIA